MSSEGAPRTGWLNPTSDLRVREVPEVPVGPACRPWVRACWSVRWQLDARPPHRVEVVPYPAVNLVLQAGASRLVGPSTRRFVGELGGAGAMFGVTFRAGGFSPLWAKPVAELTEQVLPLGAALGVDVGPIEAEVLSCDDAGACARAFERFFEGLSPRRDEEAELASAIVETAAREPALLRVEALAERAGVSVRTLQRLFERHVGVSPKWVIRVFRLQEAVLRLQAPGAPSMAQLAADLGYADQAHFATDCRAVTGQPPSAWARAAQGG